MNWKNSSLAIFTAIVVGGFLWSLLNQSPRAVSFGQIQKPSTDLGASPPPASPTNAANQIPQAQAKLTKEQEVEREKKMWETWLATPITFYGKVIDEIGNPVSGANVNLSFADQVWKGNSKNHEVSDGNGLFQATGHGLSITVMVSKDGYYHLPRSDGTFAYWNASGHIDPRSDPSNPALFQLRKIGKMEPLVRVEKDFHISKNGSAVQVDLTTGRITRDTNRAIEVEGWTDDARRQANSNQPFDWRCRVSVPGGGLVQRKDEFDFEAPEIGYETADEIDMPATLDRTWRSQVSRNYFVKLASGQYGRLEFTMTAGGEHFFTVVAYVNPAIGNRNLESGTRMR